MKEQTIQEDDSNDGESLDQNEEVDKPHPVEIDEIRRLELVLNQQHSRHQHLQSLAQGLFGVLIAMLAVLISVFVSFSDRLQPFPSELNSEFVEISQTVPIGPTAAFLTVIFNQAIFYLLILLAMMSFSISILRMFDVFVDRHPPIGIRLNPQTSDNEMNDESDMKAVIEENRRKIERAERLFRNGALRALFFGITFVSALTLYYHTVRLSLWVLFLNDLVFLLPVGAFYRLFRDTEEHEEEKENAENPESLAKELLKEEGARMRDFELNTKEKYIFGATSLVSLIVILLVWLPSILWHL